jgi:hypothetical protein
MTKVIVTILILVLIGYSLYLVAVPHYRYYGFKTDVQEYLRVAIDIPKRVQSDIYEIASDYNIPIDKGDITITRIEHKIYDVQVSWEETVDFFTLYQKTFYFTFDTRS